MNRLPVMISVVWFIVHAAPAAADPILNGGFEADFANWETIGMTSIETAAFGTGPVEGDQMARMSSGDSAEVGAVSDADLEIFLGLPAGSLDLLVFTNDLLGAVEGSAIKQTITGDAGDVVSFSWNFLTSELTPISDTNDTAFWVLSPLFVTNLADTFSTFVPSFTILAEETGFHVVNFVLPAAGVYTLGFGVVDVADDVLGSVLLVDDVSVSAVPEPVTGVLIGLGLAAAVARRRARRHSHAGRCAIPARLR